MLSQFGAEKEGACQGLNLEFIGQRLEESVSKARGLKRVSEARGLKRVSVRPEA